MFSKKIEENDLLLWEKMAIAEFSEEDFCTRDYLIEFWDYIDGWILLTDKEEWIGCFFSSRQQSRQQFNFNAGGIHFLQICIFPKYRGKGYSKHLLKIGFDNFIGIQKSVYINPKNLSSILLFEKYGFKKVSFYETWCVYICDKNYYPSNFIK